MPDSSLWSMNSSLGLQGQCWKSMLKKLETCFEKYNQHQTPVSSPDLSLPSSGSAPCMFGVPSAFSSQDTLLSQQRVASSSEVQDLVSSLPPINTVFMGAGGVQWRLRPALRSRLWGTVRLPRCCWRDGQRNSEARGQFKQDTEQWGAVWTWGRYQHTLK